MSDDSNGFAASVAEVAAFSWSLIELLFIRILPLLGFLVGQLVLHGGRLAVEVLSPSSWPSPSAPRRRRRASGWSSWLSEQTPVQQPWPSYAAAELATPTYNAAAARRWVDSSLNDYGSLYSTAAHVETPEEAEPLPAAKDAIDAELERAEEQKPSVTMQDGAAASELQKQAGPSGMEIAIATPQPQSSSSQSDGSHSESSVEDRLSPLPNPVQAAVPQEEIAMPAAEAAVSAEVAQAAPSDRKSIDDKSQKDGASPPSDPADDAEFKPSDSASKATEMNGADGATQGRVENVDGAEAKDEKAKADQESADRQPLTRRKSPSQKKRHPFSNVLPPSLSQIKHTLLQRSRKASPSKLSWRH